MVCGDERSTAHKVCWRVLIGALILGIIGIVSSNWLSSPPQPHSFAESSSRSSFPLISESLVSIRTHGSSGFPDSSGSLTSSGSPESSESLKLFSRSSIPPLPSVPPLSSGSLKSSESPGLSSGSSGSVGAPGSAESVVSSLSSGSLVPSAVFSYSSKASTLFSEWSSSTSSTGHVSSEASRSSVSPESSPSATSLGSSLPAGSLEVLRSSEAPVPSGSSESLLTSASNESLSSGSSESSGLSGFSDLKIHNLGLWDLCINHFRCTSLPSTQFPDSYGPVRVLCIVALALHVLSVLLGFIWSHIYPGHHSRVLSCLTRLEEFFAVLAGLLTAGGLAIFIQASRQHPVYHALHLDWAFWLTLVYACLLLLCGGVIALNRDDCKWRKRQKHLSSKDKSSCSGEHLCRDSDFSVSLECSEDEYPESADGQDDFSPDVCRDCLDEKNRSVQFYSSLEGIHRML